MKWTTENFILFGCFDYVFNVMLETVSMHLQLWLFKRVEYFILNGNFIIIDIKSKVNTSLVLN